MKGSSHCTSYKKPNPAPMSTGMSVKKNVPKVDLGRASMPKATNGKPDLNYRKR